ncbi:MAG: LysR family transcriptional regulator [Pseudomonadota bacterium]
MSDLRDMQLLAALARHGHFARAAEECGISQPAFSARIRNLELQIGAPVVRRGNRFQGFTREGEIVLRWARRMLADADGMAQEIAEAKGHLSGRLAIGAVPTAISFAARAPVRLHEHHPGLTVQLFSMSSSEIRQGLEAFSLDAGLTYLDTELPAGAKAEALYPERYVLLCPEALAPRTKGQITWAEAAALPLCLLTRNMRNRRILDEAFAAAGAVPEPVMEANAFTAALIQVALGLAATIAPETLANSLPHAAGGIRLMLADPVVEKPIGLVIADRDPVPPALRALAEVMRTLDRPI